jgi:uncharacterized protein with PQ loop repeat
MTYWLKSNGGNSGRPLKMQTWFERAMTLAILSMIVALFLQASLMAHNKSSDNSSLPSYILFVIASLIWMAFGMFSSDMFIALSGMFMTIGAIFALVACVSYRPGTTPGAFSTM